MKQPPFIAVEGPIGVGKTSLARAISAHFNMKLIEEIAEENPFLGKFYENAEDWSFQTEMFFLCNRFNQLEDLDQNHAAVADYHIFKNQIFAGLTLSEDHYEKYMRIFHILTNDLPQPNIMIYLTASLKTLLERIASRGRKAEEHLQAGYLKKLSEEYEAFMTQFREDNPGIPFLSFNGDRLDFVRNQPDLEVVFSELDRIL